MSENGNGTRPALPEAPASVNIRFALQGFDCQFTLRGHSGVEVLSKLPKVLERLEQMGAQPAASRASASVPNGSVPICPTHGRPMKQSQHGGWFCPEKVAPDDGTGKPVYCRQKVRA